MVQVREKDLGPDELDGLVSKMRAITTGRALLLLNGDPGLASRSGCDGVHLPESGAAVADARRAVGQHRLIGRSVHSLDAALAAEGQGADFLLFGTVFASGSHPGGPTAGLSGLENVCRAVQVPVIGIGGITELNADGVVRAGAVGVAVIGAILGSADPEGAARRLWARLNRG